MTAKKILEEGKTMKDAIVNAENLKIYLKEYDFQVIENGKDVTLETIKVSIVFKRGHIPTYQFTKIVEERMDKDDGKEDSGGSETA